MSRRLDHDFNVLPERGECHQKPLERDPFQFVIPNRGHLRLGHPEEFRDLTLVQALRLNDLVQFFCEAFFGLGVVGDARAASISASRGGVRWCFFGQTAAIISVWV